LWEHIFNTKKCTMKISLIGAGNVATVLGRLLLQKGFTILEVTSKNILHAKALAGELNANANNDLNKIDSTADLYIMAVKDDALPTVAKHLFLGKKIIVHTCGSMPAQVLQEASENYGVLYPLQSMRKEIKQLPAIPFLTDANNTETTKKF